MITSYGEILAALLQDKVTSVKVVGWCEMPDREMEESVTVMLEDGTELYIQVQGWPADAADRPCGYAATGYGRSDL